MKEKPERFAVVIVKASCGRKTKTRAYVNTTLKMAESRVRSMSRSLAWWERDTKVATYEIHCFPLGSSTVSVVSDVCVR